MMSGPTLSIITVCRDHASGLQRTLNSFVGLDFDCIETIVIDGSRGDSCAAVACAFGEVVTQYSHSPDNGLYHAMNKGLDRARGSAVLFVNAGDEIYNARRFSQLVRTYRAEMAHTIYFGGYVHAIGPHCLPVRAPAVTARGIARGDALPSHAATILPADFSRVYRYDETLHFFSDRKVLQRAYYELNHVRLDELLAVVEHGGISSFPGSWLSELRHCREVMTLEQPAPVRLVLVARLLARKAVAALLGRCRLEAIQIKRALRRAHQHAEGHIAPTRGRDGEEVRADP